MTRYLGIDFGTRRIGVALSDELGLTAQPLPTLEPSTDEEALGAIRRLIDEYGVREVIVGLPKNMNGSLGPAAEQALAFARRLEEGVPVKVTMWDERLTSRAAERLLIEADLSRTKRKGRVDQMAAALILQGFLDRCHRQRERSL
ncbi:Holliday junction resolvase [Candidatus Methylomirabilis lanthanidiphila]|uniref:Putative pre-16S rRNA nuclease n=1 Tax=Candidatus Methylomirabilis lanthanidiphila TaxID=2211376 RepID=A0A564ZL88_9BACT|nr:Holliday junction resolvase RuvX [Candidatus Methylomirabilis lanthanidiphila]VUZ86095.1 Holliday junction resolvase [Candidatus Methylomirabilis lanthanidiphila]